MTNLQQALHDAALVLEDDVRKIDAGEAQATPEHRAFLAGAAKAWKQPDGAVSGGFPVDPAEPTPPIRHPAQQVKAAGSGRPQNNGLADIPNKETPWDF